MDSNILKSCLTKNHKKDITAKDYVDAINLYINRLPNFSPNQPELIRYGFSSKIRNFLLQHKLKPISINYFSDSIPSSLQDGYSNEICIAVDDNKVRHMFIVSNEVFLGELNENLPKPLLKKIYKTFVEHNLINGDSINHAAKVIKFIKQHINKPLLIKVENKKVTKFIRYIIHTYDAESVKITYSYGEYSFNDNKFAPNVLPTYSTYSMGIMNLKRFVKFITDNTIIDISDLEDFMKKRLDYFHTKIEEDASLILENITK